MEPPFFCGIGLGYSEWCLKVFCLARLPFSWSFSYEKQDFLRALFMSVPIGISGLLVFLAPNLRYMWQKTQEIHCQVNPCIPKCLPDLPSSLYLSLLYI